MAYLSKKNKPQVTYATWIGDFSPKILKVEPILTQKKPCFDHISVVFRPVDFILAMRSDKIDPLKPLINRRF